jgi:rhodanese-related sulfurtransferase
VFQHRSLPEITLAELSDDAVLIDVREGEEWDAGHAPDAHHVPMMQIPTRIDEVPRERSVVIVCRVGARSAQVVAYLLNQGYERVANLDGGMIAWEAAGRPLVSEVRSTAIVL